MLAKRIIPCLDVKKGQVVKGINFEGLREVGDPVEMGAFYSEQGADELVYLDISASSEGRKTFTGLVSRIAERIDIPFTVGGGISSFEDAARLLDAGADKITINTAAVFHPEIISKIASRYGSQFVVVAIDARMVASGTAAEPVEATSLYGNAYWQVMTRNYIPGPSKSRTSAPARSSLPQWIMTAPRTAMPCRHIPILLRNFPSP